MSTAICKRVFERPVGGDEQFELAPKRIKRAVFAAVLALENHILAKLEELEPGVYDYVAVYSTYTTCGVVLDGIYFSYAGDEWKQDGLSVFDEANALLYYACHWFLWTWPASADATALRNHAGCCERLDAILTRMFDEGFEVDVC